MKFLALEILSFLLLSPSVNTAHVPLLSLKVAGPAVVNGVENFIVRTTLKNDGSEPVSLLNDPNGPLSTLPTDTFEITDSLGASPKFTGIRVKYLPKAAASSDDAFTILLPGQSVDVEHYLAKAYDFTTPGVGTYTIRSKNRFYVVDSDEVVSTLNAQNTTSHTVKLTGKLKTTHIPIENRASFNVCLPSQQSEILAAAMEAQNYAASALSYCDALGTDSPRYDNWFGNYTQARRDLLCSHYQYISSGNFSSFMYDCSCEMIPGVYAYVQPNEYGTIHLCSAFWQAPMTGTDSKAGTLIHESSHFTVNGGTEDYVYGQSDAKDLAKSDPDKAVMNADSHEYFAENNPVQSL